MPLILVSRASPRGRVWSIAIEQRSGTIRFTPAKNSRANPREIIAKKKFKMSVITRAANTLGFSSLKKEQEQVIGEFIDGKDVYVFANWFWKEPLFHHVT